MPGISERRPLPDTRGAAYRARELLGKVANAADREVDWPHAAGRPHHAASPVVLLGEPPRRVQRNGPFCRLHRGTTETADIAAAYHAFVARPTVVIERLFADPCYRLDVSGRIDAGSSWQLGVLAAGSSSVNSRTSTSLLVVGSALGVFSVEGHAQLLK